jgi:hypothetical protein
MGRYTKFIQKSKSNNNAPAIFFPNNDGNLFLSLLTTEHSENIIKGFINAYRRY